LDLSQRPRNYIIYLSLKKAAVLREQNFRFFRRKVYGQACRPLLGN
jgi:hypothetical protein